MIYTFGEPDQPKNLKFPATVGTKWGGTYKQNCIQFDFTGWTATATLQGISGPVALTVEIDNTIGAIWMTVDKATAEANINKSCSYVMQIESGGLGVVIAYGKIYFDSHPHT